MKNFFKDILRLRTELTQDGDSDEFGTIVYLNTTDEQTAYKLHGEFTQWVNQKAKFERLDLTDADFRALKISLDEEMCMLANYARDTTNSEDDRKDARMFLERLTNIQIKIEKYLGR